MSPGGSGGRQRVGEGNERLWQLFVRSDFGGVTKTTEELDQSPAQKEEEFRAIVSGYLVLWAFEASLFKALKSEKTERGSNRGNDNPGRIEPSTTVTLSGKRKSANQVNLMYIVRACWK
jgi:hypothetical protein